MKLLCNQILCTLWILTLNPLWKLKNTHASRLIIRLISIMNKSDRYIFEWFSTYGRQRRYSFVRSFFPSFSPCCQTIWRTNKRTNMQTLTLLAVILLNVCYWCWKIWTPGLLPQKRRAVCNLFNDLHQNETVLFNSTSTQKNGCLQYNRTHRICSFLL